MNLAPPVRALPPQARAMRSRASAHMSLALPTCSNAGFLAVAAGGGAAGLLIQLGLQTIFARSSDPVFSKSAGVTAHSVVAAMFCISVTILGSLGWFFPSLAGAATATAAARVVVPLAAVRWLGAFAFGVISFWDIPTCFAVADLRKPTFLIHHFAMAAVASMGIFLPSYYGFFFLGVVELSSIPLSVYEALERAYDIASEADECSPERCERLKGLRDGCQNLATVAFVFMRMYLFTRVTFWGFWPDALSVLPSMASGSAKRAVRFLMYASASFVALQFFWFSQIIQQIVVAKWLAPPADETVAD